MSNDSFKVNFSSKELIDKETKILMMKLKVFIICIWKNIIAKTSLHFSICSIIDCTIPHIV